MSEHSGFILVNRNTLLDVTGCRIAQVPLYISLYFCVIYWMITGEQFWYICYNHFDFY
jgi:hypothetical protein